MDQHTMNMPPGIIIIIIIIMARRVIMMPHPSLVTGPGRLIQEIVIRVLDGDVVCLACWVMLLTLSAVLFCAVAGYPTPEMMQVAFLELTSSEVLCGVLRN
eukprot:992469-Rhodomonas_salina.5